MLLDTQVLLWWLADDPRLGPVARRAIISGSPVVSVASLWEVAIKAGLGKLGADVGEVARAAAADGMVRLPIEIAHLETYQRLPRHANHGDPFDRMLIAQAGVEGLRLLTADAKLRLYDVPLEDACA